MRKIIIQGSSRKDGDTEKMMSMLVKLSNWDIIDLNNYSFSYYDYEHLNRDDDFLDLIRQIIEYYDVLVIATPVYWYSMSGIMKVFFDRLSDLLTIEKELGRKLRGKGMAVVSCSLGGNLGENFWLPFKASSEYLGLNYLGNIHLYAGRDEEKNLTGFVRKINESSLNNPS